MLTLALVIRFEEQWRSDDDRRRRRHTDLFVCVWIVLFARSMWPHEQTPCLLVDILFCVLCVSFWFFFYKMDGRNWSCTFVTKMTKRNIPHIIEPLKIREKRSSQRTVVEQTHTPHNNDDEMMLKTVLCVFLFLSSVNYQYRRICMRIVMRSPRRITWAGRTGFISIVVF